MTTNMINNYPPSDWDRNIDEKIQKENAEKDKEFKINDTDLNTHLEMAWRAITLNKADVKIDYSILTDVNLGKIKTILENPESHTFTETKWIIPDEQFNNLIKAMKSKGIIINQTIIDRHNNERSDFKAKNSKIYSPTLSKTWKRYKPWGGRKTRKYKKSKRRKVRKSKPSKKEKRRN